MILRVEFVIGGRRTGADLLGWMFLRRLVVSRFSRRTLGFGGSGIMGGYSGVMDLATGSVMFPIVTVFCPSDCCLDVVGGRQASWKVDENLKNDNSRSDDLPQWLNSLHATFFL